MLKKHDANYYREGWKKWKAINDRIISHKGYKYDDPRKHILLKLARFSRDELGHFNNQYWKLAKETNKHETI